jgi:hypothetical protein
MGLPDTGLVKDRKSIREKGISERAEERVPERESTRGRRKGLQDYSKKLN